MSKYGVWLDEKSILGSHVGYICSNCRKRALDIEEEPYKSLYCPHCGAKMMNADEERKK